MSSSSSSSSLLGECPEDDPSCAELAANLQQCANSLALIARKLSQVKKTTNTMPAHLNVMNALVGD